MLMVQTALQQHKYQEDTAVVIIGNDTDLLIIFTQLSDPDMNIFF